MKRLLPIVIALAVFLPAASPAQVSLGFGLKAGPNVAHLESSVDTDLKPKTGFAAGVVLSYAVGGGFSLQPEILYSRLGGRYEETIEGEVYAISMNLDYIDIPVLLKYEFRVPESRLVPGLFAGPYLGIKTGAEYVYELAGETGSEPIEDLKSTDFGFVFGGGLDLRLGKGRLTLELRYALGLQNLGRDSEEGAETTKNGAVQVLLGYRLR